MANVIFDNALAGMRQHMAAVEAEIGRAYAVHQRLEALRAQERDLNETLAALAPQVSAARREIAASAEQAKQMIRDGETKKQEILDEANHSAQTTAATAQRAAALVIDEARGQAAPHLEILADYKRQIEDARRQLATVKEQIGEGKDILSKIKQQAAAFAAG